VAEAENVSGGTKYNVLVICDPNRKAGGEVDLSDNIIIKIT
jgi:hypothetical protein